MCVFQTSRETVLEVNIAIIIVASIPYGAEIQVPLVVVLVSEILYAVFVVKVVDRGVLVLLVEVAVFCLQNDTIWTLWHFPLNLS